MINIGEDPPPLVDKPHDENEKEKIPKKIPKLRIVMIQQIKPLYQTRKILVLIVKKMKFLKIKVILLLYQ